MTEMIHSEVHAPIAGKAEPMFNVKIGNCEYTACSVLAHHR